MSQLDPYTPPSTPLAVPAPPRRPYDPAFDGLGGWLILIGLGVVFSPLSLGRHLIESYKTVVMSGTWDAMTTVGNEIYQPLFGPFFIVETGFNVISLVVALIMVPLYFSKSKSFPKWYIHFHLVSLAFVIADTFAIQLIRPDLPLLDPQTSREIGRSLIGACIWVPYMIFSTRVASTFRR